MRVEFLRKDGKQPKPVVTNVLVSDGGMGDHLCYLIVVDYLIKNIPWISPLVWVPDYLYDFAKSVLPENAKIYNFTTGAKKYNPKLGGISTQWNHRHSPMRVHPIDYAAHIMLDIDLELKDKNYLRYTPKGHKFDLPEKYVVISVGMTTLTKALPPQVTNQIINYLLEKGYTPVFLGKEISDVGGNTGHIKAAMADIDYSKGIDLRNKTTLVESAEILSGAKAFIGMEGGLSHLAGFTDIPIIASYTIVSPEQMMPIRNNKSGWNVYPVVADESLNCRFCQTKTPLLFEANYYHCFYKDYECIKQLTFEKWKEQIDKVI